MKASLFKTSFVLTWLLLICSSAAIAQHGGRAEPKRIEFKRGATSATFSDTVRGDEQAEYVFAAKKGQKLTIHLTSVPRRTSLIDFQGPNTGTGMEYHGGYDYTGVVPETGDYFLTVSRPTESTGKSRYRLTVTIH